MKAGRIILIVVGISVLGGLGVGGAGYLWWTKNRDQFGADAKRFLDESRAFARDRPQSACIGESVRRLSNCEGVTSIICHGMVQAFFTTCLRSAQPDPALCVGVPPNELLKGTLWSAEQCATLGRPNDQPCVRLFMNLVEHCAKSAAAAGAGGAVEAPASGATAPR